MARPLPSGPQVTEDSKLPVPESSNPTSTMDGSKKKKKKSPKSKHKEPSSPEAPTNAIESSSQQGTEPPRPSKRKHDSEHEHKKKKKKKKKKHHVAEDDVNGVSIPVVEAEHDQTAPSWSEDPASQEPSKPVKSTVNEATATVPLSQAESVGYETTGELNSKGRPKKQRGARIGGKDNLKVGFFVPEEIERLERFKLDFCNTHGLSGEQFDMMVQHSERDGGEFPCPPVIASKAEFWSDIYGTIPDRDRRSIYRFMRRHFQVTTQKPHDWTDDQDEELVQLHAEHGPKWVFIAKLLGRSDDDVTQRWKNKLEHRDRMRRGPWGEDELRTFMVTMQQIWEGYRQMLHEGAGNDVYEMDERLVGWGGVSNTMNNVRSRQQCADKWRKVRRAVMAKRASGFPDAVFDYTKAAKKREQPAEEPSSTKSNELVDGEDDEDDDGNVGDNSLPTSAATTPAPRSGFADRQYVIALSAKAAKPSPKSPSSPQRNTETNAELDPKVNGRSQESETPGNANGTTSPGTPGTPATPPSASGAQKRDAGRMARIKEKIKEANKSSASKKRKRDEVTAEPEQEAESELPATDKQSEKERKKEKKRKKRERKEQAERERIEAEAEAAKAVAQQAAESEKKVKKHKNRKSTDGADDFEAIAASTPDKKKKKKKHRRSESGAEVNGIQAEEAEPSESQRKKDKKERAKKKQAAREASDVTEQQPHESPVPTPVVDQDEAESDPDDSSDDRIKLEGTESD